MHLGVTSNGPRHTAMMGDIVDTSDNTAPVSVSAHAASGIECIELRNGENVLETIRNYDESQLGKRVRITWSGAEYRGRGRNTLWRGLIDVEGASEQLADAFWVATALLVEHAGQWSCVDVAGQGRTHDRSVGAKRAGQQEVVDFECRTAHDDGQQRRGDGEVRVAG